MWEHDFDLEYAKKDSEMRAIIQDANIAPYLSPRQAFFGGRCNELKLYHQVSENERINFVDFTSPYPWRNKYCKYPIGPVEVIREDFKSV